MSTNAIQTGALREFIRQDIVAALGEVTVSFGRPKVPMVPPYVVVIVAEVAIEINGRLGRVKGPTQENTFHIIIAKPWPDPSVLIIDEEESDANLIIAQLQANEDYHGVGKFPLVTNVSFHEGTDPNERVHAVTLTFTVATWASYVNEAGT